MGWWTWRALFVSERTAESHLSSTYAELGVESKLDLIGRGAEFGLPDALPLSVPDSGPVPRNRPPGLRTYA